MNTVEISVRDCENDVIYIGQYCGLSLADAKRNAKNGAIKYLSPMMPEGTILKSLRVGINRPANNVWTVKIKQML